jgi:hypothetical protein
MHPVRERRGKSANLPEWGFTKVKGVEKEVEAVRRLRPFLRAGSGRQAVIVRDG